MIKNLKPVFLLYLLLLINTTYSQDRTIGVLDYDPSVTDGYTLFSPTAYSNTYLIDNCGQLVNSWSSDYNAGMMAYLMPDGNLIRAGREENLSFGAGGSGGIIEKYSWEGDLLWSYRFANDRILHHHDIEPLANGNILILVWVNATQFEISGSGRNSQFVNQAKGFWFEKIMEIKPIGIDSIEVVWEWNVQEHLVQELDSTLNNYGIVEDHPELIDVNFPYRLLNNADWLHFNSIDYNEELDQILISSRNLNEIYIIDHSTTTEEASSHTGGLYGKGGDILFRWGNPQVYKRGLPEDQKFFGQHDAHWAAIDNDENDEIVVFNNGIGNFPFNSSVDQISVTHNDGIYEIDPSTNAYYPNQAFWSIQSNQWANFSSARVSGAQKLPNDHILICSGNLYRIFELDEDGNLVWLYENPVSNFGPAPQGTSSGGRDMFRAHKYPLDYQAFVGRNIEIGEVLEMDTMGSICNPIMSISEEKRILNNYIDIYPNPTKDYINLTITNSKVNQYQIFNSQGQKVLSGQLAHSKRIDVSHLIRGFYFLKLGGEVGSSNLIKIIKHE